MEAAITLGKHGHFDAGATKLDARRDPWVEELQSAVDEMLMAVAVTPREYAADQNAVSEADVDLWHALDMPMVFTAWRSSGPRRSPVVSMLTD